MGSIFVTLRDLGVFIVRTVVDRIEPIEHLPWGADIFVGWDTSEGVPTFWELWRDSDGTRFARIGRIDVIYHPAWQSAARKRGWKPQTV